MKEEVDILTRRILFEKSPLKVKIEFSNINPEDANTSALWYIQHNGNIFEAEGTKRMIWPGGPKLYLVHKNITTREIFGEGHRFYIDPYYCKILSGY